MVHLLDRDNCKSKNGNKENNVQRHCHWVQFNMRNFISVCEDFAAKLKLDICFFILSHSGRKFNVLLLQLVWSKPLLVHMSIVSYAHNYLGSITFYFWYMWTAYDAQLVLVATGQYLKRAREEFSEEVLQITSKWSWNQFNVYSYFIQLSLLVPLLDKKKNCVVRLVSIICY